MQSSRLSFVPSMGLSWQNSLPQHLTMEAHTTAHPAQNAVLALFDKYQNKGTLVMGLSCVNHQQTMFVLVADFAKYSGS